MDPAYQDTASFGRNTGYYVGMDAIRGYYVGARRRSGRRRGHLNAHPISTGLVELAGDGQDRQGPVVLHRPGHRSLASTAKALWVTGKVAMDFVKEGDAWKIWHVVEANDLVTEAGTATAMSRSIWDYSTDPVAVEFGTPDRGGMTHDPNFNWWDDYPPMPKPYDSWSDAISYGPEGFQPPHNKGFNVKEGRNYK